MPSPADDHTPDPTPPLQPPPRWLVPAVPPETWAKALIEEVRVGNEINVNMLLKHGAAEQAFSRESLGQALITAVDAQQPRMVHVLRNNGADLNFANHVDGNTALVTALGNEDWPMAEILLLLGADPDFHDPMSGNSPLTVAILEHDWRAARLLLAYGADADYAHPGTGHTPRMTALALGHGPLLSELMSRVPRPCVHAPAGNTQPAVLWSPLQLATQIAADRDDSRGCPGTSDNWDIDDTGHDSMTAETASEIGLFHRQPGGQANDACQAANNVSANTDPTGFSSFVSLPGLCGPWHTD